MKHLVTVACLLLGQVFGPAEETPRLTSTPWPGGLVIGGVSQNASGLTYHASETAYSSCSTRHSGLSNWASTVPFKRKINLNKFDDTEGNTWLGKKTRVCRGRGGRGNIVIVELEPKDGGVSWKKAEKLRTDIKVNLTNGLEGIA
ncbi:MAG: hypothetical protein Ct9H300mP32_4190 [Verrucomicrobiota bacterium]|nr:MAG: hypothetical protein Ct9H300mP32_4190 [Verrucomicrobiota bacterium]